MREAGKDLRFVVKNLNALAHLEWCNEMDRFEDVKDDLISAARTLTNMGNGFQFPRRRDSDGF